MQNLNKKLKDSFSCSICDAKFSAKGNLTRHCKKVHQLSNSENKLDLDYKFNCSSCDAKFTTKGNLTRHCIEQHSSNDDPFACPACEECFTRLTSLTKHIDTKHKNECGTCSVCHKNFSDINILQKHIQVERRSDIEKNVKYLKNYLCDICGSSFTSKQNLNKHQENVHKIESKRAPSVVCALCDAAFQTMVILDKHLSENHDVKLKFEDTYFDSVEDFEKWKRSLEEEDLAFFYSKVTVGNKTYYDCHRSGSSKTIETTQKLKWANPTKIGKNCPARMIATKSEGHIHVHLQRTHVGHTQSIRFLHLTKEERDELAGKIKNGVTFNRILDDIRESVASEDCIRRFHIVDKRDLHNIVRDYQLDKDIAHKNDTFSVEMWIQQQMSLNEDSPVLHFKMQGRDGDSPLLKEDFMIVIMTPYQRDVIAKYATKKVCVDSTHKTTDHDFQLTTLLTVDEFGAGCPVAYCISNRIDGMAMTQFFTSIKNKVGHIEAEVFMSDDAPAYINAWTEVMSKPDHLICTWHVDKNWRSNLNKIQDRKKQSEVYKACRMLMELPDVEKFQDSLEGFLVMCDEDPDTKSFGDYFKKYYANRTEKWAFCFRLGLALNTNMYLEALHKKLKYCYMIGHQNRRVDKCIGLLMRFSRDMMFERIIRMVKNKPTYRMTRIAQSHRQSEKIGDHMIEQIDDDTWFVNSATAGRERYTVSICSTSQCSDCPLSCPVCCICVHQFTCTCIDYLIKGNFCKHVHACVLRSNKDHKFMTNEAKETSAFELHNEMIVQAAKGTSAHVGNSLSQLTRLQSLLNMALGISSTATDESVSKVVPQVERIVEVLRQNQINPDSVNSSHFPKLHSNLPSHKNIEPQRFHTTKKQRIPGDHRLSKPTDMEKLSIQTAMNNYDRRSETVHTDFDHSYNSDPSKS